MIKDAIAKEKITVNGTTQNDGMINAIISIKKSSQRHLLEIVTTYKNLFNVYPYNFLGPFSNPN